MHLWPAWVLSSRSLISPGDNRNTHVNHYASYRHKVYGSRFVRCLVEVFREKAGHEDVLSMLIMVNDKLNKTGEIGKKQIGQPTTTLTKKLFLWPELYKEALS